METNYLETVLMVAKYLSFSKAAENISCTQSSVSRQVKLVEDELGIKLFERSSKSSTVELTKDGIKTIPLIEEVINKYYGLINSVKGLSSSQKLEYRIGLYKGVFSMKAQSSLISDLYLEYPNISVQFSYISHAQVRNAIHKKDVDSILLYTPYWNGEEEKCEFSGMEGTSCVRLRRQYPCIAMHANHPLAKKKSVNLAELQNESFIVNYDITKLGVRPGDKQHEGFLKSCQLAGFVPKIAVLDANIENLRDVAVMNNGWMYPTFQCEGLRTDTGVAFVPIENPIYYCVYYLVICEENKWALSSKVIDFFMNIFNVSVSNDL